MKRAAIRARFAFPALRGAAMLGLVSTIAADQLERVAEDAALQHVQRVVTGCVVMPDGSPAAGVVVVTSAGGDTITGADGSFTLEVELPIDALSLEVTAIANELVGSGSLVARASVVPAALSPTTTLGLLSLTLSPDCHPRWLPNFGGQPGTDGPIHALAVFDDGGGPALYAGGVFTSAGSVAANSIAKWDGSTWSALGGGVTGGVANGGVYALTVYDDGSGPALYAGGDFTTAGGASANRIAKWDGSTWSALGGGVTGGGESVHALTVFDDAHGAELHVGGSFVFSPAHDSFLAKWGCKPKETVKRRKL